MSKPKTTAPGVTALPGRGVGHGSAGMFKTEKAEVKNSRKTIRRFWDYMKAYKIRLLFVVFLVLVASLQQMLTPWLISIAIDRYILPGDLSGLLRIVLIMGGLIAIVAAAGWLQQYMMIRISQDTLGTLRRQLFSHLQRLDLKYYDSHTHGELMSRFTNDIENISNAMSQVVTQFLSSVIAILGVLVMMFILNPPLAFVTLATVPLIFVVTKVIGKRTRESFKQQQRLLGTINGHIEESITGTTIIRLFRREAAEEKTLDSMNRELKHASTKAQVLAGLMGPLMNLTNNIRYAVVAAAGGVFGIMGIASVGTIAAFLNYTRQFGRPISQIAQLYNSILSALAGAERVFEVLDQRPEIFSPDNGAAPSALRGEVTFRHVNFCYVQGKPILKDINLHAAPGSNIALVGPTGAGKTTIINLLTRFYDIGSGEILIDGKAIGEYDLTALRRNLGLVLQDTFLFRGTVMDNIRYGNMEADDDAVYAAARSSRAHHFIRHLPEAYQTMLSEEGGNLSQGQRQLISIARALLANPSILILDEATSSVDSRTEFLIQEGMSELMKGRTSFVIAHRLSTIRGADMILVLKEGTIVERGNHQELLKQNGFYAGLHATHFETELR
ncbi:ABC transporter ATP-binding protein [Sediminispirochaeta smaragdinae]|uniref:ABC transporter transmembrane region n=1 Tax=Sediminispirochaeta smaragdinae (strain DSM 11293 / JCM 15392 / SEBR 4228) TaxID=573413 RepID=E1R2K6_SEDSS|nr:ABC transporter ATP-binding protein [Sediminispirochaeta smaragdinae]ADK82566.1 ABC transporter transmembrane region [Sediminispirochaeta smaragdinae DSM 11293]